jgi:hypothetical protein
VVWVCVEGEFFLGSCGWVWFDMVDGIIMTRKVYLME